MNLTDVQRVKVAEWINAGAKMSEIQNRLMAEFEVRATYMEDRFLVDDLKLTPKDPDPPKPPAVVAPPAPSAAPAPAPLPPVAPEKAAGVAVTVDQLTRPGAIVSGKVTFSDNQQADWYLDQTGRLGVAPKQQGYKPSAADVRQFQVALEKEISRMGF